MTALANAIRNARVLRGLSISDVAKAMLPQGDEREVRDLCGWITDVETAREDTIERLTSKDLTSFAAALGVSAFECDTWHAWLGLVPQDIQAEFLARPGLWQRVRVLLREG